MKHHTAHLTPDKRIGMGSPTRFALLTTAALLALPAYAQESASQPLPSPEQVIAEQPVAAVEPAPAPVAMQPARDTFLDALVNTYKTNPTIKAERDRQRATDEEVAQALSGFRPTVNATYGRGKSDTAINGGPSVEEDTDNKNLTARQPLWRSGGTFSSYNSAKQRTRAGEQQLNGVEQQTLLDAVSAYMDVVSATSILELSRNNEGVLGSQLKASQERFDVGEVTRTDVAQSEARLSVARSQVISAEGQLISSIARFERVIGYKPEGMLAQPTQLPELPATLDEALERARLENPDLLAAMHIAKSSNYDVWTNKSTLLPRVDLVGAIDRREGGSGFSSEFDQDTYGIEVNIPLYQGGAEYSRVREAKNIARQRKYQQMDTKLVVEQSVTSAWEQLETSIATIRTRDEQIQAAQVALEGVRQEQEYGARTVLDVLDAEQELFSARTNLVQAQRTRVVAAYNLLLTLGKLTPNYLQLPVEQYDAREHYEDIKWQPIGF